MAYIVIALCIEHCESPPLMAYIAMAYVVMAYIVMAYIVMAYILVAGTATRTS